MNAVLGRRGRGRPSVHKSTLTGLEPSNYYQRSSRTDVELRNSRGLKPSASVTALKLQAKKPSVVDEELEEGKATEEGTETVAPEQVVLPSELERPDSIHQFALVYCLNEKSPVGKRLLAALGPLCLALTCKSWRRGR